MKEIETSTVVSELTQLSDSIVNSVQMQQNWFCHQIHHQTDDKGTWTSCISLFIYIKLYNHKYLHIQSIIQHSHCFYIKFVQIWSDLISFHTMITDSIHSYIRCQKYLTTRSILVDETRRAATNTINAHCVHTSTYLPSHTGSTKY